MSNESNPENMDAPITAGQFLELHKDVKDLTQKMDLLIEGNPAIGIPSMAGRQQQVKEQISVIREEIDGRFEKRKVINEKRFKTIEEKQQEYNDFKVKMTAYCTVGAFLGAGIINLIFMFVH